LQVESATILNTCSYILASIIDLKTALDTRGHVWTLKDDDLV